MTHRPMMFYDALARDKNAAVAYKRLSPEGKQAILTRAALAQTPEEMGLLVLSLENRMDAREDV